jgi:hypothetical protein
MKKAIKLSLLVIVAISFTMCSKPKQESPAPAKIPVAIYIDAITATGHNPSPIQKVN